MAVDGSENERTSPALDVDPEKVGPIGAYTNFMRLTMGLDDFVFEFGVRVPGTKLAMMHTKVISSPPHAKRMLGVLQRNIEKYEQRWGPIAADAEHVDPKAPKDSR